MQLEGNGKFPKVRCQDYWVHFYDVNVIMPQASCEFHEAKAYRASAVEDKDYNHKTVSSCLGSIEDALSTMLGTRYHGTGEFTCQVDLIVETTKLCTVYWYHLVSLQSLLHHNCLNVGNKPQFPTQHGYYHDRDRKDRLPQANALITAGTSSSVILKSLLSIFGA